MLLATPHCNLNRAEQALHKLRHAAMLQVVGLASSWISPDTGEAHEQRLHEAALLRELDWAAHNSLQAVVCPLPRATPVSNYARTLLQVL